MSAAPASFLKYVDDHQDAYVQRLAKAVAIPRCASECAIRCVLR